MGMRRLIPMLVLPALACQSVNGEPRGSSSPASAEAPATSQRDGYAEERERMVREQIAARDVDDPQVLAAMRRVPRHLFVPDNVRDDAYDDRPQPIGHEQTISQPYIVGLMTQLADVERGDKVLEIGTGSGYQAAVLAELGTEVYTIEIVEPLARRSAALLRRLGYDRVHVRHGDGYQGWPQHAPFDAVVITAAPPRIPEPLKEQLAVGGNLVAPVGRSGAVQQLVVLTRSAEGYDRRNVIPVVFVPMTGEAQRTGR